VNPKEMMEIRWHGRGGQGAVTSAEMLALGAISEGKFAQAFPSFGPERRGAPVQAFVRIGAQPIRVRSSITEPDVVVAGPRFIEDRRRVFRTKTGWHRDRQHGKKQSANSGGI
jgi:2-oxoacid:acceptor oxidoreductase gamma subunit (pyruvate/2-ketoisovalerate family)